MNILFFLTPKKEVAYVEETDTLRQVLEKMEYHGYSAIPLLSEDGRYIGTVTEGDLLVPSKSVTAVIGIVDAGKSNTYARK